MCLIQVCNYIYNNILSNRAKMFGIHMNENLTIELYLA